MYIVMWNWLENTVDDTHTCRVFAAQSKEEAEEQAWTFLDQYCARHRYPVPTLLFIRHCEDGAWIKRREEK